MDKDVKATVRGLWIVCILCGIFVIATLNSAWSHARNTAERDWPQTQHQLQAPVIHPGESRLIPQTVRDEYPGWNECVVTSRCGSVEIHYYPMLYRIPHMNWDRSGCFWNRFKTPVPAISAASSRGGAQYRLTYDKRGKAVKICAVTARQKSDSIWLWSNYSDLD
jgi:hypothetical protein